jgi:hypothetical protein
MSRIQQLNRAGPQENIIVQYPPLLKEGKNTFHVSISMYKNMSKWKLKLKKNKKWNN